MPFEVSLPCNIKALNREDFLEIIANLPPFNPNYCSILIEHLPPHVLPNRFIENLCIEDIMHHIPQELAYMAFCSHFCWYFFRSSLPTIRHVSI